MPEQPRKNPQFVWCASIVWSIGSLIALCVALAMMKFDRSHTAEAAAMNLRNLWPYWIASAAAWLGLTGLWWRLKNGEGRLGKFSHAAGFILGIGIAVRAAVLMTHNPALSDDVYRYIFEGRTFAAGFNPYLVKGLDRLGAARENFRGEKLLLETPPEISRTPLVTYPELATPYLPVSHLVFGALGWIINHIDAWTDPISSARAFRIGFTCIELLAVCLMFAACKRRERSPWWVALYAWHPLPISEIAGSGHQDINGIVLMIGALLAFSIHPHQVRRWVGLLTLSVLVKPITGAAGLMMLRLIPPSNRVSVAFRAAIVAAPLGAIFLGVFWLFMDQSGQAFANWHATVDVLSQKWAHFGGSYEGILAIIRRIMPAEGKPAGYNLVQEITARRICIGILIVACILIVVKSRYLWRGTAAMLLAIVLCTTTAHPWYLLWAFALFPLAELRCLWVLSLTLPWGYAVFATLGRPDWPWIPPWVYVAAYAPVYAAVVWDLLSARKKIDS